jgi:hypothetical protein
MSDTTIGLAHAPTSRRRKEATQFRLFLVVTFPLFLAAALVGRLLPRRWGLRPMGADGRRSVFADALTMANTTIPFVFMG